MCVCMCVRVPSEGRAVSTVGQGGAVIEGAWLGIQRPGSCLFHRCIQ